MKRLSNQTLDDLAPEVRRPAYDRSKLATGVVHLGIGAFHRAHQAALFDLLAERGDLRWGVRGASLRSPDVAVQMNPQDGLYTLTECEGAKVQSRVIGAVKGVLVAPQDPAGLVAAMVDPGVHIVTLTVTEKGYSPIAGESAAHPVSAAGFIVSALAARRRQAQRPFTAISCDNLPGNGSRLKATVLSLARRHDPQLAGWIEAEAAFPDTMVDRIVPAATPADMAALSMRIGVCDEAMVKTEPFLQWVIEDRFATERPDFESIGVQITESVAPWEAAKLRLLNGAHSAIAYLGGLADIEFVHQFVGEPRRARFIERLWGETVTTLAPPRGLDLASYRTALMVRFHNAALAHKTRQIAMDGSQKLPQRLLSPIAARLERGQSIEALSLAVAAWIHWQGGRDDQGKTFNVDDPLEPVMKSRLATETSPEGRVFALLGMSEIFPPRLAASPQFKASLVHWAQILSDRGALEAIRLLD